MRLPFLRLAPARARQALLLVSCLAVAACGDRAPGTAPAVEASSGERPAVLAFLAEIDTSSVHAAFSQLPQHAFTRFTRTEQFDQSDHRIAYREHVIRYTPGGPARITAADSSGPFDFGFLGRFVDPETPVELRPDLAAHLLPENPPYLDERNRDAFDYRMRPDTMLGNRAAQVVEIRARPGEGDGQNIRLVRLYADRETKALLALHLERINQAMWFREESVLDVRVRPESEAGWVPEHTHFASRLSMPLRPTQRFRTITRYDDFGSAMTE